MTRGTCDNSPGPVRSGPVRSGPVRFSSVQFSSVQFSSVQFGQEHSALFSVCQVVSHKNFQNIVAEVRDKCALTSAFLRTVKGGDAVW